MRDLPSRIQARKSVPGETDQLVLNTTSTSWKCGVCPRITCSILTFRVFSALFRWLPVFHSQHDMILYCRYPRGRGYGICQKGKYDKHALLWMSSVATSVCTSKVMQRAEFFYISMLLFYLDAEYSAIEKIYEHLLIPIKPFLQSFSLMSINRVCVDIYRVLNFELKNCLSKSISKVLKAFLVPTLKAIPDSVLQCTQLQERPKHSA